MNNNGALTFSWAVCWLSLLAWASIGSFRCEAQETFVGTEVRGTNQYGFGNLRFRLSGTLLNRDGLTYTLKYYFSGNTDFYDHNPTVGPALFPENDGSAAHEDTLVSSGSGSFVHDYVALTPLHTAEASNVGSTYPGGFTVPDPVQGAAGSITVEVYEGFDTSGTLVKTFTTAVNVQYGASGTTGSSSNAYYAYLTWDLDLDEASTSPVDYEFTVQNESQYITVGQIVEVVDGVDTVRDSFVSQPGTFQYDGTIEIFDNTTVRVDYVDFVSGTETYSYLTEGGADWLAVWEVPSDVVPTAEAQVSLTSVGEHDGVITLVDQATGETLEIIDLGNGVPQQHELTYSGTDAVDVTLGGSSGLLTDLGNGDYVINPAADGAPTVTDTPYGTYVDGDGNVQEVGGTTVTSGGTDYDFGPAGTTQEDRDDTLERIDMESNQVASGFDPNADGQLVDSAIAAGDLNLEDNYESMEDGLETSGGDFAMIPVPEDWYSGLGTATSWTINLPDIGNQASQPIVIDLTAYWFGIVRQLIAISFAVLLTISAYQFAKV